jgi:hypothetical protein
VLDDWPDSEGARAECAELVRIAPPILFAFFLGVAMSAGVVLAAERPPEVHQSPAPENPPMNRPMFLTGATALLATVGVLSLGEVRGASCAGCAAPAPPVTASSVVVVTPDQCAVLELRLDGGITKTICLTSEQLQKAMTDQ